MEEKNLKDAQDYLDMVIPLLYNLSRENQETIRSILQASSCPHQAVSVGVAHDQGSEGLEPIEHTWSTCWLLRGNPELRHLVEAHAHEPRCTTARILSKFVNRRVGSGRFAVGPHGPYHRSPKSSSAGRFRQFGLKRCTTRRTTTSRAPGDRVGTPS